MRELPTPPVLLVWAGEFGSRQHAFVGVHHSLCERIRWTVRLVHGTTAPMCPDCAAMARQALERELRKLGPGLEDNVMTEAELVHAKGGLPDPE